jgi:hypothetical protein
MLHNKFPAQMKEFLARLMEFEPMFRYSRGWMTKKFDHTKKWVKKEVSHAAISKCVLRIGGFTFCILRQKQNCLKTPSHFSHHLSHHTITNSLFRIFSV